MNKVILITGGSRGIGHEIVQKFVQDSNIVIYTYIGQENNDFDNPNIFVIECDIRSGDENQKIVTDIVKTHGHIDVLVNNAGITCDSNLHKMTLQQWKDVLDVNSLFVVRYHTTGIYINA